MTKGRVCREEGFAVKSGIRAFAELNLGFVMCL